MAGESETLRQHLLSETAAFKSANEIGVAHGSNTETSLEDFWVVHATQRESRPTFVTGVVFRDRNNNGRMDVGEGRNSIEVRSGERTTMTTDAGFYSLELAPGEHEISVTHEGDESTAVVFVGDRNVEVDFIVDRQPGVVAFAGWHNSINRRNVVNDNVIAALDAFRIINELNRGTRYRLADATNSEVQDIGFLDVNADRRLSAADALVIINFLNEYASANGLNWWEVEYDIDSGTFHGSDATLRTTLTSNSELPEPDLAYWLKPWWSSFPESATIARNEAHELAIAYYEDSEIVVERFDRHGQLRAMMVITEDTIPDGGQSSVSLDADGNLLVAWSGEDAHGHRGVFARRLPKLPESTTRLVATPSQPVEPTEEMLIATTASEEVEVAADLSTQGATIAWTDTGLVVRQFDAQLAPLTEANRVTAEQAHIRNPAVGRNSDGQLLVTWLTEDRGSGQWSIRARQWSPATDELSSEVVVVDNLVGVIAHSVLLHDTRDFTIAWLDRSEASSSIYLRRFTEIGLPRGKTDIVGESESATFTGLTIFSLFESEVVVWLKSEHGVSRKTIARVYEPLDRETDRYLITTHIATEDSQGNIELGSGPLDLEDWFAALKP